MRTRLETSDGTAYFTDQNPRMMDYLDHISACQLAENGIIH
jgi:aminoglycoside/choline kinase family phosphotransferase